MNLKKGVAHIETLGSLMLLLGVVLTALLIFGIMNYAVIDTLLLSPNRYEIYEKFSAIITLLLVNGCVLFFGPQLFSYIQNIATKEDGS